MTEKLPFHHVGYAVRDLEQGKRLFAARLGARRCSPVFDVTSQRVKVCFIELTPGSYLELVQGTTTPSPVDRYYTTGPYHMCFLIDDLGAASQLLGPGYRALPAFSSEAFYGHRCQFFLSSEGTLLELAEMSAAAFDAKFELDASSLT